MNSNSPNERLKKLYEINNYNAKIIISQFSEWQSVQKHLWIYLMKLLGNFENRKIIQWAGENGEFTLLQPETLSKMWGKFKNNPLMNYSKLSRSLRYYYTRNILCKVNGKRYCYRFNFPTILLNIIDMDCDLTNHHQNLSCNYNPKFDNSTDLSFNTSLPLSYDRDEFKENIPCQIKQLKPLSSNNMLNEFMQPLLYCYESYQPRFNNTDLVQRLDINGNSMEQNCLPTFMYNQNRYYNSR